MGVNKMGYTHSEYIRRVDAKSMQLYAPNDLQIMEFEDFAGGGSIVRFKGQNVTGKSLYILANGIEGLPAIYLTGAAGIELKTITNFDIFLNAQGTGKIKFGTHTASGDVACNGSIAILDAAGNARKLMTTA
jgi:hypothetical protein